MTGSGGGIGKVGASLHVIEKEISKPGKGNITSTPSGGRIGLKGKGGVESTGSV